MSRTFSLPREDARRRLLWQMAFFGGLIALVDLGNAVTVIADHARGGDDLAPWKPFAWEFTSGIMLWMLVPMLSWWLELFPLTRGQWWRSLPAHLLMTVPFSLLHVGGMVVLRKLAYLAANETYTFGPWWQSWLYELNKDFAAYWILLAFLAAFRLHSERDRVPKTTLPDENERPTNEPLERLVVRKRNREFIVNAGEIERIDANGNYVDLHVNGDIYALRDSLANLEAKLDGRRFARVHRRHIVNIDNIREIQPWDSGDYRILLKDGSFVNFSRRYRSRLTHLFP
jgi:DNA-binding LytR/AlgR family response regulator